MKYYYGHMMPNFTSKTLDDALFHYTNANGLTGILQENSMWCTNAFCSNDESELTISENVLTHRFRNINHELRKAKDPRIELFYSRGIIDIEDYAKGFSEFLLSTLFRRVAVFIACFCNPVSELDFNNGLLSQWRGYGQDGGYAIQFSKRKLTTQMNAKNENEKTSYHFGKVYYSAENELKTKLLDQVGAFDRAYSSHLDTLAQPISLENRTSESPLSQIVGEPLEALLNYLIYTKNQHFSEEREHRLFQVQVLDKRQKQDTLRFFNRNGLIVPYLKTDNQSFDLLSCVEGIIVGPNPRMDARLRSTDLLVHSEGLKIPVRPSNIPFTRV